MRKVLSVLLLGSTLLPLVCSAEPRRDYIFSITGVVTDEKDVALREAEVILDVKSPVYEAVAPISTVTQSTGKTGGFVFMYTSHKRGVKYTITVTKKGFVSQNISGSAPPARHHTFRLKLAATNEPMNR